MNGSRRDEYNETAEKEAASEGRWSRCPAFGIGAFSPQRIGRAVRRRGHAKASQIRNVEVCPVGPLVGTALERNSDTQVCCTLRKRQVRVNRNFPRCDLNGVATPQLLIAYWPPA